MVGYWSLFCNTSPNSLHRTHVRNFFMLCVEYSGHIFRDVCVGSLSNKSWQRLLKKVSLHFQLVISGYFQHANVIHPLGLAHKIWLHLRSKYLARWLIAHRV